MTFLDRCHRLGADLWPKTYGSGMRSDGELAAFISNDLSASLDGRPVANIDGHTIARPDVMYTPLFYTKWVDGGCRIIDTTPEYFAAMAQTKISPDAAPELRIPWPAFVVRVPPGLLVSSDGSDYRTLLVAQFEGLPHYDAVWPVSSYVCAISSRDDGHALWDYQPVSLADSLFAPHNPDTNDIYDVIDGMVEEDTSDNRIRELSKRAVAGLLFTMQHTNNWKRGGIFSKAGTGRSIRREPPPHRSIIIGRPLSIDVTEAVRADARSGARTAPSVQTLVRGHIKRQVVGVGRTGRKVVWIEPYWRGDENAPILARPHLVGPKK